MPIVWIELLVALVSLFAGSAFSDPKGLSHSNNLNAALVVRLLCLIEHLADLRKRDQVTFVHSSDNS